METTKIMVGEANYPAGLNELRKPPQAIYVRGAFKDERPKVAIVGARAATNYGNSMAEYFAEVLADTADIISTMSVGIGAAAIRGAAKTSFGRAYAVLGSGTDICYPKENRDLYDWCVNPDNGAVLSAYEDKTPPLRPHFVAREQIIAALADVILVVEAREKSGTLVIVDMALELGKTVMVIPGRITDPMSRGTLNLIKNGAMIATCPQDVLDALETGN